MIWITSEKSNYVSESLFKVPNWPQKDKLHCSGKYCFNQNRNFNIFDEKDKHHVEFRSYLLVPEDSKFGSFINIYTLNIYNQEIVDFFLCCQKKLPSSFRCVDAGLSKFGDCSSGTQIAAGTITGEVVLWELEDGEITEYQSIYNLRDSKKQDYDSLIDVAILKKQQKTFFSINCLSWNKIDSNLVLICAKDKWVRYIDMKSEKCCKLFKSESTEPLYLECNPFDKFEYIVLFENFSYFIADRRCKKKVASFVSEKKLKGLSWFFSENYFIEIEENGLISTFDRRYITQKKPNPVLEITGISGKIIDFNLSTRFDKILLVNRDGRLVAWESIGHLDYLSKINIATNQKNIQKAVWSPSFVSSVIVLDKNSSVSLIS